MQHAYVPTEDYQCSMLTMLNERARALIGGLSKQVAFVGDMARHIEPSYASRGSGSSDMRPTSRSSWTTKALCRTPFTGYAS